MSDMKKIKMHTISADSVASIKVSGAFYKRIVGVYFNLVKYLTPEKFEELSAHIANNTIKSIKGEDDRVTAFSIETMLILMSTIENDYKDQDIITLKDIDVPNVD